MRLGVVFLDKGGGIAQYTFELVRALSYRADVVCYLAAQNPMIEMYKQLPCNTKIFPLQRGLKSLLVSMATNHEASGIAQAILADAPEVILDTGSSLWIQVIERQIRGRIPMAVVEHDAIFHPDPRELMYKAQRILYPSIAQAIVSISEFGRREMEQVYPRKHHILSRHGVILGNESVNSSAVASNRNKLLFFGQITPYKGVNMLVDAYEIAIRTMPELKLNIVGKGYITDSVRTKIGKLGIGLENTYVTDQHAKEIVMSHGVIVLPYTSATQSGVAAVALANGLPCVATNVGALPEQIIDRRNGLIVPPNDAEALAEAMVEIASDAEKARMMSVEALKLARDVYSWENIADRLIADLGQLSKDRRSQSA